MTPEERRQEILKLLDKKKFITVDDLASLLFTSKPTIRRDLLILEEGGFIRRTKGGAQAIVSSLVEWPFTMRNAKNNDQKAYIAEIAKDFLNDHANIFIDSSSTCLHFAKEVAEFDNITVLTNGIKTAHFLSEESNNNVSVTCGKIYKKRNSINGPDACDYVSKHRANIAFMSCRGISSTNTTEFTMEEAMIKKYYNNYADQTVMLIDSSKFDETFFYELLPFDAVDFIITDKKPGIDYLEAAKKSDMEFLY